jgi:hypothetical protein
MLGVMSLDEAQAARENRVRQSVDVATFAESEPPQELPYDEGFHAAVVEGHLTVQQASDRGDRRALASRLVQRHGLSTELALRVADNRISLAEARTQRRQVEHVPVSSRPATRSHKMLLFGCAAVVVLGVGVQSWRKLSTSTAPPAPVVGRDGSAGGGGASPSSDGPVVADDPVAAATAAAEVQTDHEGRVLRVAGPDPLTVLIAYCASDSMAERLEPVELARAMPPLPGTRLGIFRDADQSGALLSIRINKDQKTRRWVAGNGRAPIAMREPPPFPADHPRTPVSIE